MSDAAELAPAVPADIRVMVDVHRLTVADAALPISAQRLAAIGEASLIGRLCKLVPPIGPVAAAALWPREVAQEPQTETEGDT